MKKRVLFLANHFITLYSFRKELIKRIIDEKHEVFLSLPKDKDNVYFSNLGCKVIETEIDRRGVNPLKDLKLLMTYKRIMNDVKPDIVFSYTIKPNIYGSMASNKKYKQVCNITGTGATFLKDSILSRIVKILYRLSIAHSYKVFFQNTGDRDFFIKNRMVKNNYEMLPGSGCDIEEHPYVEMKKDKVTRFLYIGRVMEVKGVKEFLCAAKAVKEKNNNTEFIIAGWNEEDNITKIVEEYAEKGYVKYIGFTKEINKWIGECDCVVLASHGGEGVPNSLLEACCMGRPCIGSNTNGIREVIDDGVNGFLFKPKDADDLIEKIEKYISLSFDERVEMGKKGREIVIKKFDRRIVIEKYIDEVEKA